MFLPWIVSSTIRQPDVLLLCNGDGVVIGFKVQCGVEVPSDCSGGYECCGVVFG